MYLDKILNLVIGNDRENEIEFFKKQYVENLREFEMLRYENSGIFVKYELVC